jgi:hypothetical protein
MPQVSVLGIDLAKQVFHVVGMIPALLSGGSASHGAA